jgi:hypothetical protein
MSPGLGPRPTTPSLILLLCLAASPPGCAPVFSGLQSAKLVGKHKLELTPSYSRVYWSGDGDSEHLQSHLGVYYHASLGLSFRPR